jgi:GT2 family glycosyltransferase
MEALFKQTYPKNLFEVIIVNNAPGDIVPPDLVIKENFKIINENQPGSYAARNTALNIAKGEIIGFTDSDCIPDQNWIQNAVNCFRNNSSVYRVAGPVKIFTRGEKPRNVELYDLIYAFPQKSYVKQGIAVTANLFSYRKNFEVVGLFNQNTMSGGDIEWGKRAQKLGLTIMYSDDVIVHHPARDSYNLLFQKAKRVGKGQVVFAKKKEGMLEYVREAFSVLRPKTWEIKRIFEEGKNLNFLDKIYLLLLRHLILWTTDFWRYASKIGTRREI